MAHIKPDTILGGRWFENGFSTPRFFDSWSAYRRALAEEGLEIRDNWVPNDRHLTRWDTVNLDAAADLASRGALYTRPSLPVLEPVPGVEIETTIVRPDRTPEPTRKARDLTPLQVGFLIGVEPVLQATGLWIVCEQCAILTGTVKHLTLANAPEDPIWKADCRCTTRRIPRAQVTRSLPPNGRLLLDAPTILRGTGLAVRCPHKATRCLWTPLETVRDTPEELTVRCQCWQVDLQAGIYRFRTVTPPVPQVAA